MLSKAQKRSVKPVLPLLAFGAREPSREVRRLLRRRPAGEHGQEGGLDGLAVVGSEIGDLRRGA